jgi:hypothetical protein
VTQSLQKVHSNEQIQARVESGGRSQLQHSHPGLSSNITEIIAERTAASAGIWFSPTMSTTLPTTFPALGREFLRGLSAAPARPEQLSVAALRFVRPKPDFLSCARRQLAQ